MSATADRLHIFYAGLLADPEAPPSLQRRVFGYARGVGDRKLLALLASHAALIDELDRELAASGDAHIVRAWMARPGRPAADVAARAAGETRVTVLAAIAQVEGLDDAAFAGLAAAGHAKVAEALLSNPDTPDDARTVAAGTYARELGRQLTAGKLKPWRLQQRTEPLKLAVAACPQAGTAVIAATDHPGLLAVGAASPFLSVDDAALACQKACDYEAEDSGRPWEHAGLAEKVDVVVAALTGPGRDGRSEAAARRLRRTVDAAGARRSQLQQQTARIDAALTGRSVSPAARGRVERARQADAMTAHALDELVTDVATNGPEAALRLLVTAPVVSAAQTYRLACSSHMGWSATDTVLRSRRRDPDAYGALLAARPTVVSERTLARCVDPSAALLACIRTAAANRAPVHRNVLESPLLTISMLLEAPASVLAQALPAQTRRLVSELVADRLGDDELAWHTFEGLIGQYDGSVRMLLEVCDSMRVDPAA